MNNKTEPVAEKSGDEASSGNAAADTANRETAVERKRSASGSVAAATKRTRKTQTGAGAPKRKKRFVL